VGQFDFVLKGRGFSRAVNASKSIAASAAAGTFFQTEPLPRQGKQDNLAIVRSGHWAIENQTCWQRKKL
jgi:hypothetical protein